MDAKNQARLDEIHSKETEVGMYVIKWSDEKQKWELRRRLAGSARTLFMNSCEYQTPLIATANRLSAAYPAKEEDDE